MALKLLIQMFLLFFATTSSLIVDISNLTEATNSQNIPDNKVAVLSYLFKIHVDHLRREDDQMELVLLLDASSSVGMVNFRSELLFARKLLSDLIVEPTATRVAIVTFAGKGKVVRNVDQISNPGQNKCLLLAKQLDNIRYTGGGTYTRGALLEAQLILEKSRAGAKKAVLLITDGFSNGGDPRPAASHLKNSGATIFTFGIRTGNIQELSDIASAPAYAHSYLLDGFFEFEALARRALHRDLNVGKYVVASSTKDCDAVLCSDGNCCDENAVCTCGTTSGHYACLCPLGYFGSGLRGACYPCPNGTYGMGNIPGDSAARCIPCPHANHITTKIPALSRKDCQCAYGFNSEGDKCEVVTCPRLKVPENGYLVKVSACSNVVNAACGIRCKIGFHLTGDSIRLCERDGRWSGTEPHCLRKTCPILDAPPHGHVKCEHEEYSTQQSLPTAYPIDTRCRFSCKKGYKLRGSKVRNCLPLSRWDGLDTTCTPVKCEPLKPPANGFVSPTICVGPKKPPYGTNCTFACAKGFVLKGSRSKICNGNAGVWTQRRKVSHCLDKTAPEMECPSNISVETLPGKNYAVANWTEPSAVDNSDSIPLIWSKTIVTPPWQVEVGVHAISYVAQDASGNEAECTFIINVVDREAPTVEFCVDPPTFHSHDIYALNDFSWDEPVFKDNSGIAVSIERAPNITSFPIGLTQMTYVGTDKFGNTNECVINITVEDACQQLPDPDNGYAKCLSLGKEDVKCALQCEDGYSFVIPYAVVTINETVIANCSEGIWNNNYELDCSVAETPKAISQEGIVTLEGNNVCDDSNTFKEISDNIGKDINTKLDEICGNDINCNLVSFQTNCMDIQTLRNVGSNAVYKRASERQRRASKKLQKKKLDKIEIKFKFIGKIVEDNRNNPKQGIFELRQKIQSLTQSKKLNLLNDKTNRELAKLALNLHFVFDNPREFCEPGSVFKRQNCVKCPIGTFHDVLAGHCRSCFFGRYQDSVGSVECKLCPRHMYTKRMHCKSVRECIPMCRPGYYSRRKHSRGLTVALEPCVPCDFGFYQTEYGQNKCIPCPSNTTTKSHASTRQEDCFPRNHFENDLCRENPCMNGGTCLKEKIGFICKCHEQYAGSRCEYFRNPCDSFPCLNNGQCIVARNTSDYHYCNCQSGYTGRNCAESLDECERNPCLNGGTCRSSEDDFTCVCGNGFEGELCEVPVARYCESPSPCQEGSSCRAINGTWHCFCRPGFLGRRCNLLPCDWLPCPPGFDCVNVKEERATRMSYRCECPTGYTGPNCADKIFYCDSSPCKNGGTCMEKDFGYTCTCTQVFDGDNCEIELMSDYAMHFTKAGTTDYVMSNKELTRNLSELTICAWLQSQDTFNYGTVISYATQQHDNAFTFTDYNGFVLYVNGERVITDVIVNDGHWHFVCVTWGSKKGLWSILVDGIRKTNGSGLATGSVIAGNGTLVIGQEQDWVGGGFSSSESFLGKISLLDVWDTILQEEMIRNLRRTCDAYHGSLLAWAKLKGRINGDVKILESPFCRGCPLSVIPVKGNVNVSEDFSEVTYSCDEGYAMKVDNKEHRTIKKKCLKEGQWEGYYTPVCIKIKCGFPGYFPRGVVRGTSYAFRDEIRYFCDAGYELRGNPLRMCQADGTWSGLPPICIGVTCKNLLAPENGDFEYVIEENERDDVSILQAGQQLEFKCNPGFQIVGKSVLTCLASGKWDSERPRCDPEACPWPSSLKNAKTFINNTEIPERKGKNEREFAKLFTIGTVITYQCTEGHRIFGLISAQCLPSGEWSKLDGKCLRISCGKPRVPVGTSLQGQSYLYGDQLTYVCPNEKTRGTITCEKDGKWSDKSICSIKS